MVNLVIEGIILLASAFVAYSAARQAKRLKAGTGTTTMVQSSTQDRQIVYGRRCVGSIQDYIFTSGDNNKYLNYIMLLGDGPFESVDELWLDNVKCPLVASGAGFVPTGTIIQSDGTTVTNPWIGKIYVEFRMGTLSQTALAVGVDPGGRWTSTDKLVGCCCAWVQLLYDTTAFASGVPNISFVVKGRNDIWDPRDSTYKYTDNPALCLAHYLRLQDLGPGLPSGEIGQDELIAAANICDEIVDMKAACAALSGLTPIKRYTFNAVVTMSDNSEDIINNFLAAMAGWRVYTAGQFKMYAGAWIEPTFTVDKSMLISDPTSSTRTSKINRLNQVYGTFCKESNNWQSTAYPAFINPDFVTADGGSLPVEVDFDFVNNIPTARRLAKISLMESRFSGTCSLKTDIRGMRAVAGQPIYLNIPELGFNNAVMMVVNHQWGVNNGAIEVQLDLKETDTSIWDWDPEVDDDKCDNQDAPPIGKMPQGPVPEPGGGGGGVDPGHYIDLLPSPSGIYGYGECRMMTRDGSFCGFKEEAGQESDPPRFYRERTKIGTMALKEYNNSGCSDGGNSNSGQINAPDYTDQTPYVSSGYVTWQRINASTVRFTVHCTTNEPGGTAEMGVLADNNAGGDTPQINGRLNGQTGDLNVGYYNTYPVHAWCRVGRYHFGGLYGSFSAPSVVCVDANNILISDLEDVWNLDDDYGPHLSDVPPTCAITETDTSTKTVDGVVQPGGPSESDFAGSFSEIASLTPTMRELAGTNTCIQTGTGPLRYKKATGEMTETLSNEDMIDDVIKRAIGGYDSILDVPDSQLDSVMLCLYAYNHSCCHAYVSPRTGDEGKDVFIREAKVKGHVRGDLLIEGHQYTMTIYFYRRTYGTGDFVPFSIQEKDFTASADNCLRGYATPDWYRIPNDDGMETIVDHVGVEDVTT